MISTSIRHFVLAASLMLLAACVTVPSYQAPASGPQLAFVQNITPLRATSRVTATLSIFRADETGLFKFVGQLSVDQLPRPTTLVPNVKHKIVAEFDIRNAGVSSRLSDQVTFTPKQDVNYQMIISYLDTGFGLRLLQ